MTNTIERALEKQRQLLENVDENIDRQDSSTSAAPVTEPATSHQHIPSPPNPEPVEPTTREPLPPISQQGMTDAALAKNKEPQDVEISIDFLEEQGMVTPTENFSKIKEEYRYIKRPLLNNAFDYSNTNPTTSEKTSFPNANLIMVSSAHSGEGKTFTAINLAISMVLEQDRTVLLVDADVINPSICQRLNIEDRPGLMDYLRGEVSVGDIILSTNIPKLKLITAGSRYHHSNEMLASEKMRQFTKELSSRYSDRIVIFDTSPLLGASETNVLAQLTGQAVIVVEQEKTKQRNLDRALEVLHPDQAVGLVLNKSKSSRKDYYGYYYADRK